jgi:hypothetical protein
MPEDGTLFILPPQDNFKSLAATGVPRRCRLSQA